MRSIRSLAVVLAAFTSLSAFVVAAFTTFEVWVGIFSLPSAEWMLGWSAIKLAVCATIGAEGGLVIAALLWRGAAPGARFARIVPLAFAGAVASIPLGITIALYTLHLARVTGELESWAIVIGLAVAAQGAGTAKLLAGSWKRGWWKNDSHAGAAFSAAMLVCCGAALAPGCQFAQPKSAVGRAAYEGRTGEVLSLRERGADVGPAEDHGFEALVWAARGGQVGTIRALLAAGATPDFAVGVNGWSPLMHAIHKEQAGAARALLDGGADANFRANGGATPVMLAAGQAEPELVRLLLERGADPRVVGNGGTTALSNAVAAGCAPCVRTLLDAAPDLALGDSFWDRASLLLARLKGNGEIVDLVERKR